MRESQSEKEKNFWYAHFACRAKDCGTDPSAREDVSKLTLTSSRHKFEPYPFKEIPKTLIRMAV